MTVTRLDVREASAHILASAAPVGIETCTLDLALGRVLAEDVTSQISLPPRNNASMDGYAVRADDVRSASPERPARLTVIETIAAGSMPVRAVEAGKASRIMTGAYIPDGADCVIRVEDTNFANGVVSVVDSRDAGRNIRMRGEDIRAGQIVLEQGTLLHAPHVGVLASVGCAAPGVFRKPVVAILATGDELVSVHDFDQVLSGRRIVSSNSYSLAAAVREAGGEPQMLGISRDDPAALAEDIRRANGCDLLLTLGGVSVGDFDYTRRVIAELGGALSLWRVKMRPGAPLGFGTVFGMPWLGLPGNPVSALVTFELFGRPLLRRLGGHRLPHRKLIPVRMQDDVQLGAPLTHFLRVVLSQGTDDLLDARFTGAQSSGMLTSMSSAHALLLVPPDQQKIAAPFMALALPLDGDLGGSETFLG